jgi:hypothetical protein
MKEFIGILILLTTLTMKYCLLFIWMMTSQTVATFWEPQPSASQQVNWYIDNFTGEYKVDDHQTEFYNGEFSGSEIPTILPQYNPYRIYADGSNKNPDQTQAGGVPFTPPVVNLAGGTYNSGGVRFSNVTATGADFAAVRATSSLVVASGSAVGAVSSDALLFVEQ